MSAFVCIFQRDGAAVDPRRLHRAAEPLACYGAEIASYCRGPLAIAVRHRHGSGAQLRHGPYVDPQSGRVAAVAGRFQFLQDPSGEHGHGAPAGHGAAALARRGEADRDLLAGSWGSFAALVADPDRGWVRLARDHLGGVAVYYYLDRGRLIAASEPACVLRGGAVSGELDETSVACFLGFRFSYGERSFFRNVRMLPPAHRLAVTRHDESVEQYWRFRRLRQEADRPPEEIADDFLRRLETSVSAQCAGLEPQAVAVSLSGGLDSTAVAALAPRGVRAFSWTFEATPEADESQRVAAVARRLDLAVHRVPGDGLYPLAGDFADRFVHPSSPYVNPFAALKCRLYQAARAAGCERVLVGDGGDALYAAREYWLRDLLANRQPGALRSLAATLRGAGRGDPFARRALLRLPPLDGLRRPLRQALRRHTPPWLSAEAQALLPTQTPWSPTLPPGPWGARYELCVGVKHSELESEERRLFARCGVERGNPFWSWPLLEAAIQLPAYWHHRDGRDKPLARLALRGLLPESVLEGPRVGLLGSFFLRGIELRHKEILDTVFRHPRSDWPRYVRREWLEPYLSATRSIRFGHTILWRVVSYELWHRRLTV